MSKKDIIANLMTVLDEEHALAVEEHRRITVKKPLTAFAAKMLAKRFSEWGDPNQAAEIMIERAWQGFSVEWAARLHHQPGAAPSTGHGLVDSLYGRMN